MVITFIDVQGLDLRAIAQSGIPEIAWQGGFFEHSRAHKKFKTAWKYAEIPTVGLFKFRCGLLCHYPIQNEKWCCPILLLIFEGGDRFHQRRLLSNVGKATVRGLIC